MQVARERGATLEYSGARVSNAWVISPRDWNNPPKGGLIRVAGLRGRSATLALKHGPDSYGRQQWGILRNGRKPDAATPREGRRSSDRKPLSEGKKLQGANTTLD